MHYLRWRRGRGRPERWKATPWVSPEAPRRCPVVGASYLIALCPACGAAQGDGSVDRQLISLHPRVPIRVPIPPAPLTFRLLVGRPPRASLGDWGERIVPARWHLADRDDAGERPRPPLRRLVPRRFDDHLRPA